MFELVSKTQVDWVKLRGLLSDDVLRNLHTDGKTPLIPFMQLLEEKPFIYALQFVHYTFYFVGNDTLVKILRERTNLKVLYEEDSGFVHGSLMEWRDFVVSASKQKHAHKVRKFANFVYSIFLNEGLGIIFDEFRRNEMKDQTFYLEKK